MTPPSNMQEPHSSFEEALNHIIDEGQIAIMDFQVADIVAAHQAEVLEARRDELVALLPQFKDGTPIPSPLMDEMLDSTARKVKNRLAQLNKQEEK